MHTFVLSFFYIPLCLPQNKSGVPRFPSTPLGMVWSFGFVLVAVGAPFASASIQPSTFTVPGAFPTSAFTKYYNQPTATSAQPQPVVSDPVTVESPPISYTTPISQCSRHFPAWNLSPCVDWSKQHSNKQHYWSSPIASTSVFVISIDQRVFPIEISFHQSYIWGGYMCALSSGARSREIHFACNTVEWTGVLHPTLQNVQPR